VNVAKGYEAGSFIFTNASNSDQHNPVTQESLLDYEGGFKASLVKHRVQLDGAIFPDSPSESNHGLIETITAD
jgi:hypothetical protein